MENPVMSRHAPNKNADLLIKIGLMVTEYVTGRTYLYLIDCLIDSFVIWRFSGMIRLYAGTETKYLAWKVDM